MFVRRYDPRPQVPAALETLGLRVISQLQVLPPPAPTYDRTGRLVSSLRLRYGPGYVDVVSPLPYARWVYVTGTGLYGPRRRYITPVRARFLVFRIKTGDIIRTRRVKGFPRWPNLGRLSEYLGGVDWRRLLWPR